MGDALTEADWRLFTTLVRFDSVYHLHFKCNRRRIIDYPNLWAYTRALYQLPGVADDGADGPHRAALPLQPRHDKPAPDHPDQSGAGLHGPARALRLARGPVFRFDRREQEPAP